MTRPLRHNTSGPRCLRRAMLALMVCFSCGFSYGLSRAEERAFPWPDKNGPTHNGCAAASEIVDLPWQWSDEPPRNIAWSIDLEGFGHSTPVIGEGVAWFTAATQDGARQYVYAVDASTGKVLHHKLLFENADPEPLGNVVNTYASPSCVLEPGAVYVHFGTYGTARLDPRTAEVVWQQRSLPCRHFRGPGSSPILHGELLLLTFDGIDQQYVAALDKQTGQLVWRTDRSTDYHDAGPDGQPIGEGDYRKAYGTPAVMPAAGRQQLVSVGSRAAFGYDVETGREIWTVRHDDFNAAARPLFLEGLAILDTGSNGANLFAVRLDDTTRGDVTDTHLAWNRTKGNARLCSPALVGDALWMLTDNGVLYGIEARTGHEFAALRLGGSFVASPVVAGNRLLACDEAGLSTVVELGPDPKVVSENRLAEGMRASPAIAGGAIFLRTYTRLYKIAAR